MKNRFKHSGWWRGGCPTGSAEARRIGLLWDFTDDDPGNPRVDFRGEQRHATERDRSGGAVA